MLLQKTYPSWLYPDTRGATTIWERWDAIKEDGSFGNAGMNSFNHYAYGAIGEWLYRDVAEIDQDSVAASAGYKHIVIHPRPGGGLTWAKASLQTPYGLPAGRWEKQTTGYRLDVEIPANTDAEI